MTYRWVLNASPLICLARERFEGFLQELPGEAILPRAVAVEIEAGPQGTLAIVILAKQRNLIPSAANVLHSLQMVGLRLDEDIIRKALKETVNEDW